MTNPTIKIHNVETGEVIERDFNESELAQLAIDQEKALEKEQAEATKAAEKAALLAKLGITEDEAKLLLS
jgi:F420-dependent methylenetetrahydromethanopterin dehydrogenase